MTSFGILTQLTDSARIVHMAMTQPPGFNETIVFNQIISLALIIYLVMASLRHIPTIIASISIATIVFAYLYTDGGVNKQIAMIFIITEIFTCVLGELIRRGIHNTQRENEDYHDTLDRLLTTFHMTKTELLAYIQLGRGGMTDKDVSDFFNHLDERTEANLIRAVEQRMAHRRMQHADISATLPSLTPTEREVCRLIIGGKTILEIAAILDKNAQQHQFGAHTHPQEARTCHVRRPERSAAEKNGRALNNTANTYRLLYCLPTLVSRGRPSAIFSFCKTQKTSFRHGLKEVF